MSYKEKLPKLVDVYRSSKPLDRRQLPLVVDENLTLVMDVRSSGLVCDNPLVRGKELEEFTKKYDTLSETELRSALEITKSELMNVLNQNVPCVGCRRSVERLYYQLFKLRHPTLNPLMVEKDGKITIDEKQAMPQVLCSIFHDHSSRLAKLIENQPKRSKKSLRCLLHSLDSQRSRPLTPIWRDVWGCMQTDCKKDVCIIEAPSLRATLETYLRKHRFCGECRTKVLRAYTLLMEEAEPCKEKGYITQLYAGIKRCLRDKHIHLPIQTDYITKLISRAEPELLGSRRERHAKTLEIAQEEVLTCLGICMYERLHRIYMRMREEECTCQVFAAVAVDTLSRSFETAVERKRGFSQLELLYAELAREEQQKQIRKEQKKIKRKRKKGKSLEQDGKENCNEEDFEDNCYSQADLSCYSCEELLKCDDDDDDYDCDKLWIDGCKCEEEKEEKCGYTNNKKGSSDYGYSSENNNGCCETASLISSISSSPEGSELACDTCCQHDGDTLKRFRDGEHPSLQQMLEGCSEDEDDSNCKLTPEEVWEFENNHKHLIEKRQELREALKKRFIDFCAYGPLPVPRLLVQSKYASN
ncbi:gametogenetin-binding protein 2-like [Tribolium castaneum]|uniref:Gametogenetin-binding protein 2-like n=1 Tax=Tribolium castaneum TaxID=7070 RepID=D6X1D0_TRICA|nr:PREDICTED: gametogenetin-binding protein 2-like [Tribolium castaneum]EFA10614.1 Gametogenetin-binding protein 2-like [Tribolium castaneum]|eukprot:XP_973483.1 PREDICTED: gametogenetin-binding protein 2-like [Tribolium castaneum]